MRYPLLAVSLLAFASHAVAQSAPTIPITQSPNSTAAQPITMSPANPAPTSGSAANDLMGQLQKALKNKNQGQALQQGIAVAGLMGCTSKTAGKPATDAFYQQMQGVGKQVEAYCKAKQPEQARTLVLSTLKAQQHNQVVMALNNCYATGKANFDMMAGPELSQDGENYARWLRDPALAETEMRNEDVCK